MRLTVLYDEGCPMCRRFQQWLANQPLLVPTDFVTGTILFQGLPNPSSAQNCLIQAQRLTT